MKANLKIKPSVVLYMLEFSFLKLIIVENVRGNNLHVILYIFMYNVKGQAVLPWLWSQCLQWTKFTNRCPLAPVL